MANASQIAGRRQRRGGSEGHARAAARHRGAVLRRGQQPPRDDVVREDITARGGAPERRRHQALIAHRILQQRGVRVAEVLAHESIDLVEERLTGRQRRHDHRVLDRPEVIAGLGERQGRRLAGEHGVGVALQHRVDPAERARRRGIGHAGEERLGEPAHGHAGRAPRHLQDHVEQAEAVGGGQQIAEGEGAAPVGHRQRARGDHQLFHFGDPGRTGGMHRHLPGLDSVACALLVRSHLRVLEDPCEIEGERVQRKRRHRARHAVGERRVRLLRQPEDQLVEGRDAALVTDAAQRERPVEPDVLAPDRLEHARLEVLGRQGQVRPDVRLAQRQHDVEVALGRVLRQVEEHVAWEADGGAQPSDVAHDVQIAPAHAVVGVDDVEVRDLPPGDPVELAVQAAERQLADLALHGLAPVAERAPERAAPVGLDDRGGRRSARRHERVEGAVEVG